MTREASSETPQTTSKTPSEHIEAAPRRDIVQHLKDLDEQAKINDSERQARIEKGKNRRTYGLGRFAMFLLGGGHS
ncbi:uncharacterized protein M421DRAFT_418462 [Didymella exigua CBS 183.55]|uniref:Uncharacterized protein n=1 Tax=Didymella exigua CBS 183.55 TaxID=1150837 RepID=A0A6A5RRJ4_9PLEO|nr:uncharacterized protein M421DRAFT_418462 [Didymella exigua CBS 183.55]KAF1930975.1 hypothetical protein M421DRAFT_418462 [Didymella exigua CBS 183.55]